MIVLTTIAAPPHPCEKNHNALLSLLGRYTPLPTGPTTPLAAVRVPPLICASQVLAFDASNSPVGRGSSRYLFAETDRDDGGEARRFVALDYRGDLAGESEAAGGAAKGGTTGWAVGTGSDGNGALGLGKPVELSRRVNSRAVG